MTNRIFEFNPEIFPLKLFVVFTDSNDFLKENFRTSDGERFNFRINEIGNDANTFYYVKRTGSDENGIMLQFFTYEPPMDYIAHESYHFARRLLEYCNDEGSNETYALLVGWAAKCVDNAMKQGGKPICKTFNEEMPMPNSKIWIGDDLYYFADYGAIEVSIE